jgi:hypothetical protein
MDKITLHYVVYYCGILFTTIVLSSSAKVFVNFC